MLPFSDALLIKTNKMYLKPLSKLRQSMKYQRVLSPAIPNTSARSQAAIAISAKKYKM
jgi:hypothetical protein